MNYSYLYKALKACKEQDELNMKRFDLLLLLRYRITTLNRAVETLKRLGIS